MTHAQVEKVLKTPEGIAATIMVLRNEVTRNLPESRARSMVVTKLDEAYLWLAIIGVGSGGFE